MLNQKLMQQKQYKLHEYMVELNGDCFCLQLIIPEGGTTLYISRNEDLG